MVLDKITTASDPSEIPSVFCLPSARKCSTYNQTVYTLIFLDLYVNFDMFIEN